jgi:hypothetical protein
LSIKDDDIWDFGEHQNEPAMDGHRSVFDAVNKGYRMKLQAEESLGA